MGRRCKGGGTPFPTFAAKNGAKKKFSHPWDQGRERLGRSQVLKSGPNLARASVLIKSEPMLWQEQDQLLPSLSLPCSQGRENFFLPAIFRRKSGERGAVSLAPAGHPRHLAVPPGV